MLANIDLDQNKRPLNEQVGLFRVFPNFLRETAFIDRFSGLLPGWDLPRISKDTPSKTIGLKGDIFGEILHSLRSDISYRDYVKTNMELQNCDDMRDSKAVEAGATGLLKILFPDQDPTEEEFYLYCVNPALELRQRIRDELCKLDREYVSVTFTSKIPDDFQRGHRLVSYFDPSTIPVPAVSQPVPEQPLVAADEEEAEVLRYFGATEKPAPRPENGSELTAKTLHIREGETGYSYQNLFGPYLRGAKKIYVTDPYVRLEYQLRNFIAFAGIIDTTDGQVELKLTTSAENAYQEKIQEQKFKEIGASLAQHGILFTFEFDPVIHDRSIQLDNGWCIYPGRGLDIFQKPDSKYELSEIDQTKRKCRETDIIFQQAKG